MDIYRVSDGAYERNKIDFAAFESWHDLVRAISDILDIPVDQVIVFRDDGRALDEAVFHELWERAGREGIGGELYVFDREAFSADPEEWVRGLEEEIVLDIELPLRPLRSAHLANHTLAPFLANLAQIHALEGGLNVQRAGLRIAGENLVEHASKLIDGHRKDLSEDDSSSASEDEASPRGWSSFQRLVERELERERLLIGPYPISTAAMAGTPTNTGGEWGMEQDMHVISCIEVHEVFKRSAHKAQDKPIRRTSGAAGSPTAMNAVPVGRGSERAPSVMEKRKTLADYVNAGKMKTVHENCRKLYEEHQNTYSAISNDIFALQSATDQIAQSIEGMEVQVEREIAEMVGHAEAIADEARALVLEDPDVHWQSLRALDSTIRGLLVSMTHLKNDFCLQLHIHLHSIAIQQSAIARLGSAMSDLETALVSTRINAPLPSNGKITSGFPHLDRLRNMLSAYLTACVEILWRKQLAELLEAKSSGLTEALAGYLEVERVRRRAFEQSEVAVLPPDINVFRQPGTTASATDRGTPDFEFSVKPGYEDFVGGPIRRDEIEALIVTIEGIKQDPIIAVCSVASPHDILDQAITKARNLLEDMDLSMLQLEALWGDRASIELGPAISVQAELNRLTSRYAALQLSHERLQDQVRDGPNPLGSGFEDHLHALEHEIATLQIELNQRQNAHEQDAGRMEQLEADRSQLLQGLSDARNDEAALEMKLHGLEAEKDGVLAALNEMTAERDQLVRGRTDQVEEMVEARLKELRGDGEQVQLQNAALLDEMEKLKQEHQAKMDSLQNRHAREVDGLRAELGMAKAQLKESQKTKAELMQDLANVKADLAAVKEESASAGQFSLSSIKLASKYHDCVSRLHTAIQSSATISGSASALLKAQKTAEPLKDTDDQSVLQQELTTLDEYDLEAFTDAVNRTMSLVKKWQKSCRSYRDRAKDKIAFSNFGKGDLALFLPTRNATAKSWAAFNISSPHHFLNVHSHPSLDEQVKHREWIVARITQVEVDVVNTAIKPDSNPFGLAEGITYYSLSIEPFTPPAGNRLRQSSTTMPAMTTPGALLTARTPPVKGGDYFGLATAEPGPMRDIEPRTLRRPSSVASSQGSTFSKKGKGIKYGNATKAGATLAVSSPGDHQLGVGLPSEAGVRANGQRRSFTTVDGPSELTEVPKKDPSTSIKRPTLQSQLRPGSFSRRVVSTAEADSGAGLGRGALDILKRFEAEREGEEGGKT